MMDYKGYLARVEFDDEAGLFHGEVVNTHDVITFQGTCVGDLRQALIDSVEEYLAFCAKRGEKPEKPFSGKFLVRLDPLIHQKPICRRDGPG
jgi:predicted HicB family RNase H-like nuclease